MTFLRRIIVTITVILWLASSIVASGRDLFPGRLMDVDRYIMSDSLPVESPIIDARQSVEAVRRDSTAIAEMDSMLRTINLEEVVVTAPMKPIFMKGDTTIINTDAFRTRDGAYLEDLIRLIPGMAYDRQTGSLTYNGKPLTEIMVNGESIFKNGKEFALENLRADILSGLKIYDKASDENEFLGLKGTGNNYVLDLQTRSEFNGMLSASASVSYGTEGKKNAGVVANYFKPKNNGFLNLKSGNKDMPSLYKDNRSDQGVIRVNKNFGGKLDVMLGGFYRHTKSGNESSSTSDNYLPNGNTYNASQNRSLNLSRGLSSDIIAKWTPNDKLMVNFSGSVTGSRSRNSNESRNATFDSDPDLNVRDPFSGQAYESIDPMSRVNDNSNSGLSGSKSADYKLNFSVTRKFNKKGTALSFSAKLENFLNRGNSFNRSITNYFRLTGNDGRDSILHRNQHSSSPSRNRNYELGMTFIQPLVSDIKLELSYKYVGGREFYSRNTYNLSPFFDGENEMVPGYLPVGYEDTYVDSLSNRTLSHVRSHRVGLNLSYYNKKWSVRGGCDFTPEQRRLDQKTGTAQADTIRQSLNFHPQLSIRYNNKKWDIGMNYDGLTSQPALSSLLSLTDNSDPLNVSTGNPNLKATYRQNFYFDVRHSPSNINFSFNFSNVYNEQTSAVYYDPETGGRTVTPVNISGSYDSRMSLSYYKFVRKLLLSGSLSGDRSRNVGLVNEDFNVDPRRSVTNTNSCKADLNCSFVPQNWEIHFNGAWGFRRMTNDLRGRRDIERSWSFGLRPSFNVVACGLRIGANADYRVRAGTAINKKDNEQMLLDAEVEWRFLKGRVAQISLAWKDILNRQKNYSYFTSYSGIYESYSPSIGSYVLVTFSYRFIKQL